MEKMHKAIVILFTILIFSCGRNSEVDNLRVLTSRYFQAIDEIKEFHLIKLEARHLENPQKSGRIYSKALELEKIVGECIQILKADSSKDQVSRREYDAAIKSIEMLVSGLPVKVDSLLWFQSGTNTSTKQMEMSLTLIEIQILEQFYDMIDAPFCGWNTLDVTTSAYKDPNGRIKIDINSKGFQMLQRKYLKVDSVITKSTPITYTPMLKENLTFYTLYFDSLPMGKYCIYGRAIGFYNDKKVEQEFTSTFEK